MSLKPSDFTIFPWSSVLQKAEAESVATNIMIILNRTGNQWRKLTFEEYQTEREKDGEFSKGEQPCFERVIDYCISPETARLFSPEWNIKTNEP